MSFCLSQSLGEYDFEGLGHILVFSSLCGVSSTFPSKMVFLRWLLCHPLSLPMYVQTSKDKVSCCCLAGFPQYSGPHKGFMPLHTSPHWGPSGPPVTSVVWKVCEKEAVIPTDKALQDYFYKIFQLGPQMAASDSKFNLLGVLLASGSGCQTELLVNSQINNIIQGEGTGDAFYSSAILLLLLLI